MAVKGVCIMTDLTRNSTTHTHFNATVRYAAMDDISVSGTLNIADLDPSALGTTLTDTIQAAVKAEIISGGVSFGLLDVVRLLPGLL